MIELTSHGALVVVNSYYIVKMTQMGDAYSGPGGTRIQVIHGGEFVVDQDVEKILELIKIDK
jgi:hypothetical protein